MRSFNPARIKPARVVCRQNQCRAFSSNQSTTHLSHKSIRFSSIIPLPKHRSRLLAYSTVRFAHNDSRSRRQSRPPQTRPVQVKEKNLLYGEGELYMNPNLDIATRFEGMPEWLKDNKDRSNAKMEEEHDTREILSQEWLQHEEEIALRIPPKKKPVPFTPEVFTVESLITNRIATASSASASNQAMIESAMAQVTKRDDVSFSFDSDLARQVAHGKVVRFKDADEKARILALAEEHAMDTTAKRNRTKLGKLKDGEDMEFESPLTVDFKSVSEKHRKEVVDRVLRGKYEYEGKIDKSQSDPALSGLKKALDLNGTYQSSSEGGFLGLFKRLMPQTSKR